MKINEKSKKTIQTILTNLPVMLLLEYLCYVLGQPWVLPSVLLVLLGFFGGGYYWAIFVDWLLNKIFSNNT